MARPTMAALIALVRTMTGSPTASEFTDDEIQNALDGRRREYRYAALDALETRTASGVEYHDFTAPYRHWEDGVALVSGAYAPLTPDDSDLINGRWSFDADMNGSMPILLSGFSYDVNAAAADICTEWAAKLARDFDFQADQDEFKRSQKRAGLLEAAKSFRSRSLPGGTAWLIRTDMA